MLNKITENKYNYFDINDVNDVNNFCNAFFDELNYKINNYDNIILLCIGTDRITGDSLGPLVGEKLNLTFLYNEYVNVFGTLEEPVHAKNLDQIIRNIYEKYTNPLVIAVDACLGKYENIGKVTVSDKCIKPGSAVNKNLPTIGHISITGIVNYGGGLDMLLLQNTRLSIVMKMSNIICNAITYGILKTLSSAN